MRKLLRRGVTTLAAGCLALAAAVTTAPSSSADSAGVTKVLTIIEENHGTDAMLAGMPYLAGLAHQYAYASNYTAITHPSLPNYLAVAGGSTFGVTTDGAPVKADGTTATLNAKKVGAAQSVFGEALANGQTAKLYAEGMSSDCALLNGGVKYVVRHNPWTYFSAERDACNTLDVPKVDALTGLDSLKADAAAGTLPNAGMLIPNVCNDAHSCTLKIADRWLKANLPAILAGPDFTSGDLVVVITADEAETTSATNAVLTVVLHAGSPSGVVVDTALNHYSLSGFYSHVLGAAPLRQATDDFAGAFGL